MQPIFTIHAGEYLVCLPVLAMYCSRAVVIRTVGFKRSNQFPTNYLDTQNRLL